MPPTGVLRRSAAARARPERPLRGRPRQAGDCMHAALAARYELVRKVTEALCAPLSAEDAGAQSMSDASPAKWHLAHTTWFFETLVLGGRSSYQRFDPAYARLFNSYYQRLGTPLPRARRGLMTRPSLEEVLRYRAHVDAALLALLRESRVTPRLRETVELGLQHEQQHQELILTDIKHLFWRNPLRPAYRAAPADAEAEMGTGTGGEALALDWRPGPRGTVEIGHDGEGFAFDNESPRHRVVLRPHAIASRPATNRDFREFIEDGGYRRPELWLSDGWDTVRKLGWRRPLYWSAKLDGAFTLHGPVALDPDAPVCHLSYYEADAFARWSQARLPTEAEWEASAGDPPAAGFGTPCILQPGPAHGGFYHQVWTWTASAYQPYPGYRAPPGALGEYNGKFMCNQLVLRGGSCVTPPGHARRSYRNFFPPQARWQFSGVRLARDL